MENGIHECYLYSITIVAVFQILTNMYLRFQVLWDVNLSFWMSVSCHFEETMFLPNVWKHPATQRHLA
jgi:hypothetical protein